MNIALSLKIIAVLALVTSSTAAIVQAAPCGNESAPPHRSASAHALLALHN